LLKLALKHQKSNQIKINLRYIWNIVGNPNPDTKVIKSKQKFNI
jgi:hypothetical protein